MSLQLSGTTSIRQRLHRSKFSSFCSSHNTRLLVRSNYSSKVHFQVSRKLESTIFDHKCGAGAHGRVNAGGSDRESSALTAFEADGANREFGLINIGGRFASLTTVAINLSLLLLHLGTGSSAEAAGKFVVATFPWEKSENLVQPEPSKGSCATCIGVVDETLGTCNSTLNCISSFDDRPKFFVAPWEFPGQLHDALKELKETLLSMGGDVVTEPEERYVHAIFTDKADGVIDDVEFLFSNPSEDATVVIRAASRAQDMADRDRNRRRLEQIRSILTWEQVPILRNRSRALFFLESPWDSFGPEPPPTYDYKGALDVVPE